MMSLHECRHGQLRSLCVACHGNISWNAALREADKAIQAKIEYWNLYNSEVCTIIGTSDLLKVLGEIRATLRELMKE